LEPSRETAFPASLFADIAREKRDTQEAILLEIGRLNEADTQHLVNFYFPGNRFKKDFHRRIYSESDGNPLFILELLNLFARIGTVSHTPKGWVQVKEKEDAPVPSRIHELISRRLGALGEKEVQVLEAAAVEGVSFTSESVCALTRIDRLAVLNILRALWRQQLIDLKGDGYRFNPSIVREVVYRQMMPELKREYHQLVANLYLESPPPGKGFPAEIAKHFHRGGNRSEAIRHYSAAGYAALKLHADREALTYFDHALELLEKTPLGPGADQALDIHLNRAEIFIRMGEPERSGGAADEALALAKAMSDEGGQARALKVKGKICHLSGDREQAEAYLEQAFSGTRSAPDQAEVLNLLGLTAENRGDHVKAMNCFSRSLAISSEEQDRLRMAQTLNHMGRTFLNKGDPQSALDRFKKALDITGAIGDRRGKAVNTNNVGILLRRMDRFQDSLKLFFQAARIFKEIRYPNGAANTLWNIGGVYQALGNRKKAEKYVQKAQRIFENIGSQQGVTLCQHSLGNILAEAGEVGQALAALSRSLDMGRKIGYPRVVAYGLASRGALELALGLIPEATQSLKAAEKSAKGLSDLILNATILGPLGVAHCLADRCDEGLVQMKKALDEAQMSKDTSLLCETHLRLCRAELMARHIPEAKESLMKASSYIGRKARPSRKADLYFEAGLLDLCSKRAVQAYRKFETALGLRRKLAHPLKMLECIHGLEAAYTILEMKERIEQLTLVKKGLLEQIGATLPTEKQARIFQDYHGRLGPVDALWDPDGPQIMHLS
jgi:tetratricopeptide (TPR) repeat protein